MPVPLEDYPGSTAAFCIDVLKANKGRENNEN